MRKFEKVSKYKNIELTSPKRATKYSAGYDLALAEDVIFKKNKITLVPTGHKVLMNDDDVLLIFARSSLCIKYNFVLANGVGIIDKDYYNSNSNEGEIFIPILNLGKKIKLLKGERIAQALFLEYKKVDDEENIKTIRTGGFGSSDKIK